MSDDPMEIRDRDPRKEITPILDPLPTTKLPYTEKPKWYDRLLFEIRQHRVLSKVAWIIELAIAIFAPEGRIAVIGMRVAEKISKLANRVNSANPVNQHTIPIPEGGSMASGTVKPGIKTTEFWMTLIANVITVLGVLGNIIPAQTAAVIVAALTGLYNVLRALSKTPDITTVVQK